MLAAKRARRCLRNGAHRARASRSHWRCISPASPWRAAISAGRSRSRRAAPPSGSLRVQPRSLDPRVRSPSLLAQGAGLRSRRTGAVGAHCASTSTSQTARGATARAYRRGASSSEPPAGCAGRPADQSGRQSADSRQLVDAHACTGIAHAPPCTADARPCTAHVLPCSAHALPYPHHSRACRMAPC